ncbi:substrate-binding domain-containing protein [Actinoplanes sp. DH11]|uniref:substrate-binding domain-containing protein n=1 Tax=Actinoplanes sp. DH11 TaxID=2857011 RepID=UPI001E5A6CCA|nr:substrate-binding domain-containing protein [Actinoplanes sp. DH11]
MSDNEWPRELPAGHGEWSDPPHRPRRAFLAAVLVLAVLAAAGGLTWQLMSNGSQPPDAQPSLAPVPSAAAPSVAPCPDPELSVVAAPEIEPLVREAAATLNPTGQRCAPIAVRAEEPGVTALAVGQQRPGVWIPSSSAWLTVAKDAGAGYATSGKPIAYSPVLVAAPEGIASLYAKDDRTSWTGLIQGATESKFPTISMPDPLRTTAGLLSVHGVHAATARTTEDTGIAQLRALTLRSRLEEATADPVELLTRMTKQTDATTAVYDIGIFPVLEQQLTAYQEADHPVRLAGFPPADGRVEADYPFAIGKGADKDLAAELREAISEEAVVAAGFRAEPTAGVLRMPQSARKLLAPVQQWAQYRDLAFQVLLLIDSSGSMNEAITDRSGRASTKASLLRESGVSAAELFGDDTTIGMWYFGTAAADGPAHTEVVPYGAINGNVDGRTRREALRAQIGAYKPERSAGTPLYQAVLDGVETMRAEVKPGTATVVVVLTDGADGGTKFAMSADAFAQRLAAAQDPARPLPIIAVGYGPDANLGALTTMAEATGGKAIPARNPADLASAMAQAFLAAHERS